MNINNNEFEKCEDKLSFVVGRDSKGNIVRASFLESPHLLIAGSTGTGTSAFVLTLLEGLLKQNTKEELKVYVINPHEIEFKDYINCPQVSHNKVFTKPEEVVDILDRLCEEMNKRYELFADNNVSNFDQYNNKIKDKLPAIVVFINEYNDYVLSDCKKKFFENLLKLVMLARAAGMHIVFATQKVSRRTITHRVLIQFPTKIAFEMDKKESEIFLGNDDAANLQCGKELLYSDFDGVLTTCFNFEEYRTP